MAYREEMNINERVTNTQKLHSLCVTPPHRSPVPSIGDVREAIVFSLFMCLISSRERRCGV
jgi:hypothetical protein